MAGRAAIKGRRGRGDKEEMDEREEEVEREKRVGEEEENRVRGGGIGGCLIKGKDGSGLRRRKRERRGKRAK